MGYFFVLNLFYIHNEPPRAISFRARFAVPGAVRLAERDTSFSVAEDLIACVEIKFRTRHGIDARLPPFLRLLDGVP